MTRSKHIERITELEKRVEQLEKTNTYYGIILGKVLGIFDVPFAFDDKTNTIIFFEDDIKDTGFILTVHKGSLDSAVKKQEERQQEEPKEISTVTEL